MLTIEARKHGDVLIVLIIEFIVGSLEFVTQFVKLFSKSFENMLIFGHG